MLEREVLEEMLAEGCSLEEIGRRVDRHPSTVSYWLKKYGLKPAHGHRHASRGGIPKTTLADFVDQGLTVAEIASQVDRSPTTVRYWLRFHDLQTKRSARLRAGGKRRVSQDEVTQEECRVHGLTRHVRSAGRLRCSRCNSEAVARFRRNVKLRLVEEAGGACRICGYSRCVAALQFHHLDPASKRFGLSVKGVARSWETVREEARKCALLCANCHSEVEAGVATIPPSHPGRG